MWQNFRNLDTSRMYVLPNKQICGTNILASPTTLVSIIVQVTKLYYLLTKYASFSFPNLLITLNIQTMKNTTKRKPFHPVILWSLRTKQIQWSMASCKSSPFCNSQPDCRPPDGVKGGCKAEFMQILLLRNRYPLWHAQLINMSLLRALRDILPDHYHFT